MTHNAILSMPAGPDLDREISSRVMGRPIVQILGRWFERHGKGTAAGCPLICDDGSEIHYIPRYSTDIACAWKVVERMAQHYGREFRLTDFQGASVHNWYAEFMLPGKPQKSGAAQTACLAICRAALLATQEE